MAESENVFKPTLVSPNSTMIAATIQNMSVEQLLLAAQMAGFATINWTRRYLGGADVSITRPEDRGKLGSSHRFEFVFDEALQIYEFPREARDILIQLLVEECCK